MSSLSDDDLRDVGLERLTQIFWNEERALFVDKTSNSVNVRGYGPPQYIVKVRQGSRSDFQTHSRSAGSGLIARYNGDELLPLTAQYFCIGTVKSTEDLKIIGVQFYVNPR